MFLGPSLSKLVCCTRGNFSYSVYLLIFIYVNMLLLFYFIIIYLFLYIGSLLFFS